MGGREKEWRRKGKRGREEKRGWGRRGVENKGKNEEG